MHKSAALQAREEIKKTAALKPLAASHLAGQEKLKASETQREGLLSQLKSSEEKLNGIKEQEERQRGVLSQVREKDAAKSRDVPALIQERDECRQVLVQSPEDVQCPLPNIRKGRVRPVRVWPKC